MALCRRASRIRATIFACAFVCIVHPSRAQQGGTDVGGQPARRKVTKLPKLTTFVEAEYPPERKASGTEASVLLTIEISATGTVANVPVAQSAGPDFDAAALSAARQFIFSPAEVDDKPAPAKITFRYSFVLKPPPIPDAPPPPLYVPVPVPVPVPDPSPS